MRILWVKAGGLVPPDIGGKIRSFNLLKELARRHSVTLFTSYGEHVDDQHSVLEKIFTRVVTWPLKLPATRGLGELLLYLQNSFSGLPHSITKYCRREVRESLAQLLQNEAFDVIVCDFAVAGGMIPWEHPCPKVVFTHNVEALVWKRLAEVATNPIWRAVCQREFRLMERAENEYLRRSDHVLTVSEADREFFSHVIDPPKITVIPTGVDVDYFQPSQEPEDPHNIAFTGAMDWMANEDAILFFVSEVLPIIRTQIPETVFWVVGRSPSPRVRALESPGSGVRVTGRVDDIRPYLREAAVYVVPIRVGSGTRLKIFEAMAMGKAIVSTRIGAEGLPVNDGKDIVLADQPDEFAACVTALMQDSARRRQLAQSARELVGRNYSWARVAAQLGEILERVSRRAHPATPRTETSTR